MVVLAKGLILLLLLLLGGEGRAVHGFVGVSSRQQPAVWNRALVRNQRILAAHPPPPTSSSSSSPPTTNDGASHNNNNNLAAMQHFLPALWVVPMVLLLLALPPLQPAQASTTATAVDAVSSVIQSLQDASSTQQTFAAYETIASMITEGTGVGGMINYQGIQLQRGYIADEDTSIYNPGLTLLTETEKSALVQAIRDSRNQGLQHDQWSDNNQAAYEFLKEKLDPWHIVELHDYLTVFPIYAAVVYASVLTVQQVSSARQWFIVAYLVGAVAVFAPVVALLAFGSQ